jgi:hypothetical protein
MWAIRECSARRVTVLDRGELFAAGSNSGTRPNEVIF